MPEIIAHAQLYSTTMATKSRWGSEKRSGAQLCSLNMICDLVCVIVVVGVVYYTVKSVGCW